MAQRHTERLRRYGVTARRAVSYERVAFLRRLPVNADVVLYESFAGNGMLCNPEAIFRRLVDDPEFGHLRHVWALRDLDAYADTVAEFADHPRVSFVRYGSTRYHVALATAKYLFNNATFSPMFGKRPGQVYVNTWHGTPLKAMGYDMPGGAVESRNVLRNLLAADYLLAPNDATASMYLDAYRLTNLFRGAMLRTGTPRIDDQFASDAGAELTLDRLRAAGVHVPRGQQVVLYAPTWKGEFRTPDNDIAELRARVEQLRTRLAERGHGATVLLKVHQQVYSYAVTDPTLAPVLVPNDVPANAVLRVSDVLVTDYSSIFVDFLATGRPVLFLAPDLAEYVAMRGVNLPVDRWPGPICADVDDLAARIAAIGTGAELDPLVSHAAAYAEARADYCADEDGSATDRLVDAVFRGGSDGVRRGFADGRPTVLIYLGGMLPNGITASALSLLDTIDHDRVDVSAFYLHAYTGGARSQLVDLINPRVRLFPRVGGMLAHKTEVRAIKRHRMRGERRSHATDVVRHRASLSAEWRRCFGDARFDCVVDFSGYSPFWDKLLLQDDASTVSIWMHNDLRADADREVDGRFPHRANLTAMFDLYRHADHLVSVSPALAEVNRVGLAAYAAPAKFSYARNTVTFRRVLALAHGIDDDHPAMTDASARPPVGSGGPGRTFVTAGRLSPEKNHERLIRAFAQVHHDSPEDRLVILGSGPLEERLYALVAELGLRDAVSLPGHLPNPYEVMAGADCFVLSSDYEGQPMVILEALVLGLPVISTAFGSVASAFPSGCGVVVERDVDALAAAMRVADRDGLQLEPFDYLAYNRDATEEFYRAIGLFSDSPVTPTA